MNAVEKLEAAIAKLEELRGAAFPGKWEALGSGVRNGDHWYVFAEDESIAMITANDGSDEDQREPTAVLISILHRTIDAQLVILRTAKYRRVHMPRGSGIPISDELALADAILGVSDADVG